MRLVDRVLDRRILALALPATGSSMLLVVHRWVDTYWVGKLGDAELASLAVSSVPVWMYSALGTLVGVGLTALVARYVGAGRPDGAGYVGHQGLRWSAVLGLLAGLLGQGAVSSLFAAAHADPAVAAAGEAYTRIYWGAGALVLLQQAGDAVFRGHGNTRIPFLAGLVALVANVVLDPLLIHGLGPFPALGVPGAAWATVAATAAGVTVLLVQLTRRGHLGRERPPDERLRLTSTTPLGRPGRLGLDATVLRRMSRVGLPLALSGFFFLVIYLVLYRIAEDVGGAQAQAGLGLGHTGESVAWVVGLGWAAAASALVGQSLGAGRPRYAERAARRAGLQASVLCLGWGIFLWFGAHPLAALLASSTDPGIGVARAHAAAYLRTVSFCLVPQAIGLVLDGGFGGAGHTMPPLLIGATFSLIRIPLALLLAIPCGMGAEGLWLAIAATSAARGVGSWAWFRRGTWKTRTV